MIIVYLIIIYCCSESTVIISALTLKERMIKVEKRTEQYIEKIGRTSLFVLKYKKYLTLLIYIYIYYCYMVIHTNYNHRAYIDNHVMFIHFHC